VSIRSQLIGSWRLVGSQSRRPNGELEADLPAGLTGILTYDQSGNVAAQLSRRDRSVATLAEECKAITTIKGTPDTAQPILGYAAYFGTFTVNEIDSSVAHHLDAALWPGDIGKDIHRHFTIAGDQLTITFNMTMQNGVQVVQAFIWERMK